MKKVVITLMIMMSCFYSKAQTAKEIVEKYYKGSSVQDANFTKSGKVYLTQTIKLTLYDDNSVYAVATTKMKLDESSYSCSGTMTGTFNPKDWTVYLNTSSQTGDALPQGLRWCKSYGKLTFYKNATHPGYYLLKGTLSDDCGGSSFIEYTDY